MALRIALAAAVLVAAGGAAADAPRIHAITNARIVTAPGQVIERGTIVLRDGLVEAAGPTVAVPPDATVIEAEEGWSVYPAFIDAASAVGLDAEAGGAPAGGDRRSPEPKPLGSRHELKTVHPEDRALDRVDLAGASVARHREMGFAVAHVLPDKGVFRGESTLLLLRSGPAAEVVLRGELGQVMALESSSFMARQYPSSKFGAVAAVRQVLLDGQRLAEWNRRYAANPAGMDPPGYRTSDAPLLALLAGERLPVFVSLNALDPGRFRALADEFGLKPVAVARGLGDRPADLLAARMPVLLPLDRPEKPALDDADDLIEASLQDLQQYLLAPKLPGALDAGGARVAFVTSGMKNPRAFQENLAAVVKAGLPPDRALAALTTVPAALLGVERSMGTLQPGKLANLVVVQGDLFAAKPVFRHLFVAGFHEEIEPPKTVGNPSATVDPRGTWEVSSQVMGRASESTWTIAGKPGAYRGSSNSARGGKRDFASVELAGDALTVTLPGGPGGESRITVVVAGDRLAGDTTLTSDKGSVTMKVEGRRTSGPEESQQ